MIVCVCVGMCGCGCIIMSVYEVDDITVCVRD
jgi:hypothetical protein